MSYLGHMHVVMHIAQIEELQAAAGENGARIKVSLITGEEVYC